MSETVTNEASGASGNVAETGLAIRRQVEQLSYLPGSASVAIKFIELGKDPDAGPADYDKIISSDAALSSKLLSLANSSWFGTRHKVTKVLQAINLLGINNVRTLAISYCMTGMYNRLKISKKDVDQYWQASLCKGVAAKTFANAFDSSAEDEAFLGGLFQDMALPVMHSVAGEKLLSILRDKQLNVESQLAAERQTLGADHTEIGRLLAAKLELPESYVDMIAFHHDAECLGKFCESQVIADSIQMAALFPHLPLQWHSSDVEKLGTLINEKAPEKFANLDAFLEAVQKEFDMLYGFFQPGEKPQLRLEELVPQACEELADATATMMGQTTALMNEAAQMGATVHELAAKHEKLDDERRRDTLTDTLTRDAFLSDAQTCLESAARYSTPSAVLYLDIDKFKPTNDAHGHHFGDYVLREVCNRIQGQLRKGDLFGRIGGDEFVVFLNDVDQNQLRSMTDAIMKSVRHGPYVKGKTAENKTISMGALWVGPCLSVLSIEKLIEESDALMYTAKRSGPGQTRKREFNESALSTN